MREPFTKPRPKKLVPYHLTRSIEAIESDHIRRLRRLERLHHEQTKWEDEQIKHKE